MEEREKRTDIEQMRAKLAGVSGKRYWRGVEELSGTPEFKAWVEDEFPHRSSLLDVDRRTFLKLMGASMALAGLAGCRSIPEERIVPYVKAPEDHLPGQTQAYATAMVFGGYAFPVLVTSNEGRPTKIEGNDLHPASGGKTDVFAQAEILQMYDPDRIGEPRSLIEGQIMPATWDGFLDAARVALEGEAATRGAGLRILTETVTSPTLIALMKDLLKQYPEAKWYQFQPVNRDNEREGSRLAFGKVYDTRYDLTGANVVLSLDGDILDCTPHRIRNIGEFMQGRDPDKPMNRLYAIESTFSKTGAFADHRAAVKPSEIEGIARSIAQGLSLGVGEGSLPQGLSQEWIQAMIRDLSANKGASVVVTGERQSPVVHALVHAINKALGNVGKTVLYTEPIDTDAPPQSQQLATLTSELNSNQVKTLFILGGNPAFYACADNPFAAALAKLTGSKGKFTARLGHYEDETSSICQWVLPESHFLEAWGDACAPDGTVSIIQPLISPLYDSRSALELLGNLLNRPSGGYDLVRATWLPTLKEKGWRDALNNGFIPNTASKPANPNLTLPTGSPSAPSSGIEAVFAPDPTIYDGRYANNGWLQELPKPMTKLSWDNAVILGPSLAVKLNVGYEDMVTVATASGSVDAPVYVLPGMPDDTVTLHIGYGRKKAGKVGDGTGFDFNSLRTSKSPWMDKVDIKKAGRKYDLASSQTHHSMEGRDVIREGTLDEYKSDPSLSPEETKFVAEHAEETPPPSLYNLTAEWAQQYPELPQWGMTIDLNTCTGCGACEIACQAENNISTVGKPQVQKGRIMHWIRVDRFFRVDEKGQDRDFQEPIAQVEAINPDNDQGAMNPNNVKVVCMPVPCMHCESAPCEPVCPVAATIHSHEGLNQMVYNRCVGTRYCSNNCPYKVRRFNFFNYQFRQAQFQTDRDITILNLLNNPDVTVRSRGVMEKCTYCVQRINAARITAKKEDRRIKDGEVVPACAQACPSKAITFGDLTDTSSKVFKLKTLKRNYGLFEDLNTRPRTSYLVKVRNVNKEMPA
jgi:molybdopterin-containing oxidoreductase family iron-sulfur binding subunit